MNVSEELNTVKGLVTYVLKNYPATRNNDTKLYAQCCRELGAITVDDVDNMDLSIITVHKIRQVVQNKENLYLANDRVQKARGKRALDVKDYMRNLKQ